MVKRPSGELTALWLVPLRKTRASGRGSEVRLSQTTPVRVARSPVMSRSPAAVESSRTSPPTSSIPARTCWLRSGPSRHICWVLPRTGMRIDHSWTIQAPVGSWR